MLTVGQSRQEPLVKIRGSLGCFRARDTNSKSKLMLIIDKRQRGRHAYGSAGAEARRNIQKQAAHKMMEITLARCGVSVFMTLIVIKCVKIREYSND